MWNPCTDSHISPFRKCTDQCKIAGPGFHAFQARGGGFGVVGGGSSSAVCRAEEGFGTVSKGEW